MFSGIIEATGKILALEHRSHGARFTLDGGVLSKRLKQGDSVAVNGVCLTVASKVGNKVSFDVSKETLNKTNLSFSKKQQKLNLELPVTAQTMMSGHMVQGHVEGMGKVKKWFRAGEDVRLFVDLPADLLLYCVPKGSITINGVSLTIASMKSQTIEVALIPYTLEHTNLDELQPGNRVNIETDIVGRYVVETLKKTYDKRIERRTGRSARRKN